MLTCVMIFCKFQSDFYCSNQYIARMCGIELEELNYLEVYTLQLLDYRLLIDLELFAEYDKRIGACY
jgi:hypothetical protein